MKYVDNAQTKVLSNFDFDGVTEFVFGEDGTIAASNDDDLKRQILDVAKQCLRKELKLVDDPDGNYTSASVLQHTLASQILRFGSVKEEVWPRAHLRPRPNDGNNCIGQGSSTYFTASFEPLPSTMHIDRTFIALSTAAHFVLFPQSKSLQKSNLFQLVGGPDIISQPDPFPSYPVPNTVKKQITASNWPVGSLLISADLVEALFAECVSFKPETKIQDVLRGRLGTWQNWNVYSDVFRAEEQLLEPGNVFMYTRKLDTALAMGDGVVQSYLRHPGVIQETKEGAILLLGTPVGAGRVVY